MYEFALESLETNTKKCILCALVNNLTLYQNENIHLFLKIIIMSLEK